MHLLELLSIHNVVDILMVAKVEEYKKTVMISSFNKEEELPVMSNREFTDIC